LHVGTEVRSPINRLTPEQQEDVLQLVVRLNGGRGDMSVSEAASKELKELDQGEWESDVADAATFLKKRDYALTQRSCRSLSL